MRIQSRIFIGFLIVVGVGFSSLLYLSLDDFKPQFRKATEEPLVDASRILASIAATTARDGEIDAGLFRKAYNDACSRPFSAEIYGFFKTCVDYRVYITDASGKVLFDSAGGRDEGRDYSRWNDVKRTLNGLYGARTTEERPGDPGSSIMYVASPIIIDGRIAGVLSVGKPSTSTNKFAEDAKKKLALVVLIVGFSAALVGMFISWRITAPINRLTSYARAVRDGERAKLPSLGGGETRQLGEAFEEMRIALDGKKYIEEYVQALTHEIKSPLSAIKGATELLSEKDMPPEQRGRFLSNIMTETDRISSVVERLLLLASLEKLGRVGEVRPFDMGELVADIKESLSPVLGSKGLALHVKCEGSGSMQGDQFLVRHAVFNLVQNAMDFSPPGGNIYVECAGKDGLITVSVRDEGSGIPEYAANRIYERFYSLQRPGTGRKSSGLGLCLVREVANLHKGGIEIVNSPEGGAVAMLTLPVNPV